MEIGKTYIQQTFYDGRDYRKGDVVDIAEAYVVYATEFPFEIFPEAKEYDYRDWSGEDGRDVYIPEKPSIKSYEMTAKFVVKGTDESIKRNITEFIKFLRGINDNAVGARLVVFNERTGIGRRDVVVKKINNTLYYREEYDDEKMAEFSITFEVNDPTTEIVPVTSGNKVIALNCK